MIMQVTLRLFEQQMQEGVSLNTTGAVQNMFLIKNLDGIIIHVERTSLIQRKSKGIVHLKNDVRTAVVGQKGTSWVEGAKGNKINFSGF
jgi:tyrosine-protein phosphatase YwqE